MNYPDWVEKHKEKSTSVKKIGDSYYLYRVTSERVAGKKHPVSRQTYIGKITEKGVERAGIRIVPEKTIGKTLGKLVPSVDVHLRDVVLIKTLVHSRDVLAILDAYKETAGSELKRELEITVADMRSGNYEVALTRLEARVGSTMMSDVTRGLIGVIRGDETSVYWGSLVLKFSDYQRQNLKTEASKAPKKVRKLSMVLLICFMLVYVAVIGEVLLSSLGGLFG